MVHYMLCGDCAETAGLGLRGVRYVSLVQAFFSRIRLSTFHHVDTKLKDDPLTWKLARIW